MGGKENTQDDINHDSSTVVMAIHNNVVGHINSIAFDVVFCTEKLGIKVGVIPAVRGGGNNNSNSKQHNGAVLFVVQSVTDPRKKNEIQRGDIILSIDSINLVNNNKIQRMTDFATLVASFS